jgi:hypothetical protein
MAKARRQSNETVEYLESIKIAQTISSSVFTSAVKGVYIPIPELAATITVTKVPSRVSVRCVVNGTDLNNYQQLYHIYRNGVQITPNGLNTGFTPNSCYAFVVGGAGLGATGYAFTNFEFIDNPGIGTHTYQVYVAKPTAASSNISINNVSGGSSTITVEIK